MKFLVIWRLSIKSLQPEMVKSVAKMTEYATSLKQKGKLVSRYHIVGGHGGAWIYNVESHEEMERLLAAAPVYNYANYKVMPLAEMETPG